MSAGETALSEGEFIGALAVLVTLVYLALQIRSNTRAVRASTFQNVTGGWQNQLLSTLEPGVASLVVKARHEPAALGDSDIRRLWYLSRAMFRLCENDYFQFRNGTFDEDAWRGYRQSIVREVVGPRALRAMWVMQRDVFSEEFAAFMDEQAELARNTADESDPDTIETIWKSTLAREVDV